MEGCYRLVGCSLRISKSTSAGLAESLPLLLVFLTLSHNLAFVRSTSHTQDKSQFHDCLTKVVFWSQTSAELHSFTSIKSSTFCKCTQREVSFPELLNFKQNLGFSEEETSLQSCPRVLWQDARRTSGTQKRDKIRIFCGFVPRWLSAFTATYILSLWIANMI